ncbi:hypothetical protein CYLTODRAFT_422273 [Cylindrobasidium torrendii FP15055 ss-10]|uniref:Uncharacterized protein n=1 Tax=Cylindrobasidium torrendii FP15055 ss-10 TaxID=1314674 RepID=A0A0D7BB59_9AGAR|nr:hypothetical protein CYLTODRAFT_422273 [Cylindrobasidium torrendii FP15055 ss-10]
MDAVRGSTPTRVNFLDAAVADAANDRSFARFFKQKSVKELENVVRQKLGLDEGVNVELHHLCYDHSLALNDKDDFDMLRHYAATSDVVKISFVLREELEDALPRKRRRLNPAPPAAPDQIIEPAPENDASENTPNIETTKPKKSKVATQVPTDNVVVALPNRSTENKRKRVEPPASPEPVPVAEESIKSLKKRKKAKKKHGAVEHTNDMSDIARAINAASTANNAAEADDAEEEQPKKRKRTKKAKEDESAHVKEVVQPEPEPVVAKPAARPSNGRRKSQASSETLDAVRAFLMNGIAETPAAPSADTTTTPKKTKTKVPTKPLPVDDTRPGNSSKLSAVLGDAKRKEKEDAAEAQERGSAAKPRGRPKKKTEEPSVAAEPKGKGKKVPLRGVAAA